MAEIKDLKPNVRLLDNRTRSDGRIIRLLSKMNPMGNDIGPFWQVENEESKRKTLIREDTFEGKRWDILPEEDSSGSTD